MPENYFHDFEEDQRTLNMNFAYKKGNICNPTETCQNEFMAPSSAQSPKGLGPFSPIENPIIVLDE